MSRFRRGAFRPTPSIDRAPGPLARASHARVGVRRLDGGGRRACASSTAASSAATRWSARSSVRSRSRSARTTRRSSPRTRRATSAGTAPLRRDRPLARAATAELVSVRVLGAATPAAARSCSAGLRWAIEQGFDVINMSLSTTKQQFAALLHELADSAYFKRTVLVASAHNMPVESYPWRFSSVISVGSHERTTRLPTTTTRIRRSSSSRAASASTSPGWTAASSRVHRQQLRDAAHLRHLRADPRGIRS